LIGTFSTKIKVDTITVSINNPESEKEISKEIKDNIIIKVLKKLFEMNCFDFVKNGNKTKIKFHILKAANEEGSEKMEVAL
jgi:hypothetical protein